jgi:hypothetical protein
MGRSKPAQPTELNYKALLGWLGLFTVGLAALGAGGGYLVADGPGAWGALVGAGLTGTFFGTSALVMHLGRKQSGPAQARNLVIGWFAKLVLLFFGLTLLSDQPWLAPRVFGVTVLVGVVGTLVIEGRALWRVRPPVGDSLM